MMDELERRLLRLEQRFGAQPDLRMGVVHSVAPLKVVVDGDPSNTPVPASSMVLDLTPGERVQCIWVGGTVRVLSARRYGTLRGTTADMTLLDTSGIAVEGMRFFNTDDSREYVYAAGVWSTGDSGWIYPATTAGTNHPTAPIKYRKLNGRINLGGRWTPTSDNQTAFTLPVGFKPDEDIYCFVDRTLSVRALLQADGQVRFVGPGGTGPIFWATAPGFIPAPAG